MEERANPGEKMPVALLSTEAITRLLQGRNSEGSHSPAAVSNADLERTLRWAYSMLRCIKSAMGLESKSRM